MKNNLDLWEKVEKTNPKYTKKAKVGGNDITSIAPQYQILNATEQFGSYGHKWGFKNIEFDYSITNTPITLTIKDWNTKKEEKVNSIIGLVGFKATFFFPDGEFEITNSIKIFTDNKHSKIDDNYAKKLETDALTKALSKLGFNADIFLGKFDDSRYVDQMNDEFGLKPKAPPSAKPPVKEKRDYTKEFGDQGIDKSVTLAKMMLNFKMTAAEQADYAIGLDNKTGGK